jgi:hypothetical protein
MPEHDDRCLLHRGGPCGATCVDGGGGSVCVRNCTRQIGYGESLDLRDALGVYGAKVDQEWTVSDDRVSTFFAYTSPTDGRRHQVWVDTPKALGAKVRAIAAVPGLKGTGMWTANAFHRRDSRLAGATAAAMFRTLDA